MPRVLDLVRRLATLLGGALLAAAGVWVFLHALAFAAPVQLEFPGGSLRLSFGSETNITRLTLAIAGVAALLVGLVLAVVSFARNVGQEPWVTLEHRRDKVAGNSTVRVSRRALRGLAARMVENLPGVRDSDPVLELTRKGWRVSCPVYVSDEPGLPALLREVERTLRHDLEAQTGHPVVAVDVRAQITPFNPKTRVH